MIIPVLKWLQICGQSPADSAQRHNGTWASHLLKCPALSSPLLHSVEILRGRISSIIRNGDREGMQYIILRKENLHILL